MSKDVYGTLIACLAVDTGDMEPKQKQEALKRIREDSRCSVIVISILSGNTGEFVTSVVVFRLFEYFQSHVRFGYYVL